MKPRNEVLKIEGSLGGEVTKMRLDSNAVVHIMSVLTNLYSDAEKAIIREYATNALDSHIFAGVTDPIEITLPTRFNNEYVVQDFGLGLSKDEIQTVYGTYGASTKRDSDDVAGCLGLGSKSALAYTGSFVVVGVKDGVKVTAVIGLDEDGAGRIEVVDEVETDERNGVTVRIPTQSGYDFEQKVRTFFSYWPEGTVLIDGETPKHFSEGLTRIDDTVWYAPSGWGVTVIMGGVAYHTREYDLNYQGSLVVEADMGDVDFTPSRESLHLTARTREYLRELISYATDQLIRTIQRRIDSSTSMREVIELADQIPGNRGLVSWMGTTHDLAPISDYYLYAPRNRSCSGRERQTINVRSLYDANSVVMVNKPHTPMSKLQRDKMDKYFSEKEMNTIYRVYYFRDDKIPFMGQEATIIDFNEINAVEMPKKPRVSRQASAKIAAEAKYDHWDFDGSGRTSKKFDKIDAQGKTVLYIRGKRTSPDMYVWKLRMLKSENVVLVWVEANREKRFLAGFPDAKHPHGFIESEIQKKIDTLTEEDWVLYGVEDLDDLEWIEDRSVDPHLNKLWDAYKRGTWNEVTNLLTRIYHTLEVPDTVVRDDDYISRNYPLISRYHKEASIEYINAMYTSRNNGKVK